MSRPELRWSRPTEGLTLLVCGATAPVAWRVALVVGTLLSIVNQGGEIMQGQTTAATVARVGFNYLVPYVVASVGYLRACREDELPTTDTD